MDQINGQSEFLRVHHFYRFVFRLRRVVLDCQSQGDTFAVQILFMTIAIQAIQASKKEKKVGECAHQRNAIDACESAKASQHRRAVAKLLFLPAFLGMLRFHNRIDDDQCALWSDCTFSLSCSLSLFSARRAGFAIRGRTRNVQYCNGSMCSTRFERGGGREYSFVWSLFIQTIIWK